MSMPPSGQKTVRPVSASPLITGQLMALRPRCRGSSDGWYWIVPRVGAARSSAGTMSVTNAMTCRSGANPRNSSSTAGPFNDAGRTSGSPAASAASASGSGRPPSGGPYTATTSSPRSSSASSTALPKACWPCTTIRMRPSWSSPARRGLAAAGQPGCYRIASARCPTAARSPPSAYPAAMDKDGLIPIGRFARLTDLSPRFLRKLDERGLLCPVHVDPDSHYRYYAPDQTRLASLLHLARQLGMTVDQLDDVVAAFESGRLRPYLERRRAAVEARLAEDARLLRLLDRELERGEAPMVYDVALKDVPALLVLSAGGSVPRVHPHDPWALEDALRHVGSRVAGHLAHHGETPDPTP